MTLRLELFDELDGPEARVEAEAINLTVAAANALAAAVSSATPKPLNVDPCAYNEERGASRVRPFAVLPNLAPLSYSFTANSFRRADEFECVLPLSVLPVPPEAIRVITCYAVIRQVSAEEWADGLALRGTAVPTLAPDESNADFAGICSSVSYSVSNGVPTVKLPFRDYIGLLAGHKIPPGTTIDQKLPLSAAIRKLLVGTPAEGLCVKWVDSAGEPTVDQHVPKATKKPPKKPPVRPVGSTQSYLDAITEECSRLGCVARLRVTSLEISEAGPLYEGRLSTARSALLLGQVIESLEAEHQLVGVKTQSIQLTAYNPDTGDPVTARWPPDPKGAKGSQIVQPGKPPRLPPVAANIGLPGYEQLEESVALIPWGPVSSQDRLKEIAQMIFLERTRQRVKYVVKTHAPWSDPADPDRDGGDLLRLRAGDTVTFGVRLNPGDEGLLPVEVRGLLGELGREAFVQLLGRAGLAPKVAQRFAEVLTAVPRLSQFRVDELTVTGSDKNDTELSFKLVNFVQITDDLQGGKTFGDTLRDLAGRVTELALATPEALQAALTEAYQALERERDEAAEEGRQQLDALVQTVMRAR